MKDGTIKRLLKLSAAVIILTTIWAIKGNTALYYYNPFEEPSQIRCTCYVTQGTTASGIQTRPGIIAGKREWMGKTAVLYSVAEDGGIGELIGIYEFADTGAGIDTDGDGIGDSIKRGLSVDVWCGSIEEARAWIRKYGDYVYIQIVEAEG